MTRSLDNTTIFIVSGQSLATFRLQKELERDGAAVCIVTLSDAPQALRHSHPDAVLIDFALGVQSEDLADELQDQGVLHLTCGTPSLQQSVNEQVSAAQDVTARLAELVERDRSYGSVRAGTLDASLYAM